MIEQTGLDLFLGFFFGTAIGSLACLWGCYTIVKILSEPEDDSLEMRLRP